MRRRQKTSILGPILACCAQIWVQKLFSWVLPPLDVRHCPKLKLHAILKKTYDPNSIKCPKTSFWIWLRSVALKLLLPIFCLFVCFLFFLLFFFFVYKNLASSVSRYHGQLSSCTISDKTNDPVLRKLSDRRTDRQTDGQEWFHRMLYLFIYLFNYLFIYLFIYLCIYVFIHVFIYLFICLFP